MVRLNTLYQLHGLCLTSRELPDYLPLYLEFLSLMGVQARLARNGLEALSACAEAAPDLVLPTHEWSVPTCVDAVLELLAQHGIAGVSMRAVAQRAGARAGEDAEATEPVVALLDHDVPAPAVIRASGHAVGEKIFYPGIFEGAAKFEGAYYPFLKSTRAEDNRAKPTRYWGNGSFARPGGGQAGRTR